MFSIANLARTSVGLGLVACAACAGIRSRPEEAPVSQAFYTVTAEIALARHQPRVAALQYAAAAANETDAGLFGRAVEVAAEGLQPTVAESVAARWTQVDPQSVDAQRAAAQAALALHEIDQAALHYSIVLQSSPLGTEAEFAALEAYLAGNDNIFGSRQLADRLASSFASSAAALRVQGFTALRADDPAAAVRSFTAALAIPAQEVEEQARRELLHTLARARILSGDVESPLAQAQESVARDATAANRLEYALLLMTARRDRAATEQLEVLGKNSEYAPLAMRLLGLIEFQEGHLEAATARFTELVRAGKDLDDAFYYLGLIADRDDDPEHALSLYAQVQKGDNAVPALLRATAILKAHGAAAAADELLDRLMEDEPESAPEIIAARARMDADGGDFSRASDLLKGGVLEYPDNVDLRYAVAALYEKQGQIGEALKELTRLLKARPEDPAALNALGYTLADHSLDLPRARRLIESAHHAAPTNAAILDSLGWVLFRQGHGAEAENYLRIAYLDDHGGDIAAHLGEVLWQLGKPAEAEQVWFEAGAIETDNRLLKATMRRFHAAMPTPATRQPSSPVN